MTVRINPYIGRAGRVTIDEIDVIMPHSRGILAEVRMQQYLEGDLCLLMCPGVRMVKGYVLGRGRFGSGFFEVRQDFVGWADVRAHSSIHADNALNGFVVTIDFDIQLPRTKRRLKLSSVAEYHWKKIGGFDERIFTTLEPLFTHHVRELSPKEAKMFTELCRNLASGVERLLLQYAEAIYNATESPHRTAQCDPKTGRPGWIKKH